MDHITIVVNEFIKVEGAYKDAQSRRALRNLMNLFLAQYSMHHTEELLPVVIAESIEASVRAYTSNKDNAIAAFRNLIAYLQKHHSITVEIDFPPIPIMNLYERLMFMAKYLQTKGNTLKKLEDLLWLSDRTIREDYSLLTRQSGEELEILGKKFVIPEIVSKKGLASMPLTVHPLFLTGNLTQVLTLLKGLKAMSQDPVYHSNAMTFASSVWDQLSEYAKARILYVTEHLVKENVDWFHELENYRSGHLFLSEFQSGRNERANRLIDCLKNRKPCFLEYLQEDGTIRFFENCKVTNMLSSDCVVIDTGIEEIVLDTGRVLCSAFTREELY